MIRNAAKRMNKTLYVRETSSWLIIRQQIVVSNAYVNLIETLSNTWNRILKFFRVSSHNIIKRRTWEIPMVRLFHGLRRALLCAMKFLYICCLKRRNYLNDANNPFCFIVAVKRKKKNSQAIAHTDYHLKRQKGKSLTHLP